jgi:hypothetical protein
VVPNATNGNVNRACFLYRWKVLFLDNTIGV